MRILLVEDDAMIGESLRLALRSSGYVVNWVQDAETAMHCVTTEAYDLLLLDVGLPKQSGIELLQGVRRAKMTMPVLMITARDSIHDRVAGLDAGADDYLVKPFALPELEARIRALARRNHAQADPLMMYGNHTLNPMTKELTYGTKTLVLSAREYALMYALLEKPGAMLSRAQLEERLYGWGDEIGSNAVEVLIHQLRKKWGSDLIRNSRGVGYSVARV